MATRLSTSANPRALSPRIERFLADTAPATPCLVIDLDVVEEQGEGKREAFARVQAGEDLPINRIQAPRVTWLVDAAVVG